MPQIEGYARLVLRTTGYDKVFATLQIPEKTVCALSTIGYDLAHLLALLPCFFLRHRIHVHGFKPVVVYLFFWPVCFET